MSDFFNRNILVLFRSFSVDGQPVALSQFFENKIDVSLNAQARTFANTGEISITNAPREKTGLFLSVNNLIQYEIKAGYSRGNHDIETASITLPTISAGFVQYTSWKHAGGDTILTFNLTEGLRGVFNTFARTQGINILKKGQGSLNRLFGKDAEAALRKFGLRYSFIPSKEAIIADINKQTNPQNFVVKSAETDIKNILNSVGLNFFLRQNEIVIYKASGGFDFADDPQGAATPLNFQNGLLSADLGLTKAPLSGLVSTVLNFNCLFNPVIRPRAKILINEPKYSQLNGEYYIFNTRTSLTNRSGGQFNISGMSASTDAKTLEGFVGRLPPG